MKMIISRKRDREKEHGIQKKNEDEKTVRNVLKRRRAKGSALSA